MKSTGTKAKQVATVAKRKGVSVKRATRIVTQHRKAGEAVGGFKVKSKGLHPQAQSGTSGGSHPASKPVKARGKTSRHSPAPAGRGMGHDQGDSPVNVTASPPVTARGSSSDQAAYHHRNDYLAPSAPSRSEFNRPGSLAGSSAPTHGGFTPSKPVNKAVPSRTLHASGDTYAGGHTPVIGRGTTGPLPGPVAHTEIKRPGVGKGRAKPVSGGGGAMKVR